METRPELEQRFAADLHELIDRQQAEDAPDAWLADPDRSFFAFLEACSDRIQAPIWSEQSQSFRESALKTPNQFDTPAETIHDTLAFINAKYMELTGLSRDEEDQSVIERATQAAVAKLQRQLATPASTNMLDHWSALSTLAFIAIQSKPEGYDSDEVPRPRKGVPESLGQKTFRLATGALDQFIRKRMGPQEEKVVQSMMEHDKDISDTALFNMMAKFHPELREPITNAVVTLSLKKYARQLLDRILSPDLTSETITKESDAWLDLSTRLYAPTDNVAEAKKESEPLITYIETRQQILGPDVGTGMSSPDRQRSTPYATSGEEAGAEEQRDAAVKQWLSRIAMDWTGNETVQLAVIDLQRSGNRDYYAAILPETKSDGTVIEHAVAANPRERNAVFVYRAESGMDESGTVHTTWRQAFIGTKLGARALGARKMLHTPTLDDRIADVLTRNPADIAEPRYRL